MNKFQIIKTEENIFKVENENRLLSLIIKKDYESEGISFFTSNQMSQQLGYMKRPAGYKIQPHIHLPVARKVIYTQEVLFIKSGTIRVNYYDNNKSYLGEIIVTQGDFVFLSDGGHGFDFLEESEIVEVKQGPYSGEMDKEKF